jgi:hypothetical protein
MSEIKTILLLWMNGILPDSITVYIVSEMPDYLPQPKELSEEQKRAINLQEEIVELNYYPFAKVHAGLSKDGKKLIIRRNEGE